MKSSHQTLDPETSHSYSYSYYTPPQTKSQERRRRRRRRLPDEQQQQQQQHRRNGEPQFLQHRLFFGNDSQSFGLSQPWPSRKTTVTSSCSLISTSTTTTTSNRYGMLVGSAYEDKYVDESPTQAYLARRQRRRLRAVTKLPLFKLEPQNHETYNNNNNNNNSLEVPVLATPSPMQLCHEPSLPVVDITALGKYGPTQSAALSSIPSSFSFSFSSPSSSSAAAAAAAITGSELKVAVFRLDAENQKLHARVGKLERRVRVMFKVLDKMVAGLSEDEKEKLPREVR